MKIENSNIQLSSQHSIIEKHTVTESVKLQTKAQIPDSEKQDLSLPDKAAPVVDMVTLSDMARLSLPVGKTEIDIDEGGLDLSPEMRVLKLMVEHMLGIEVDLSFTEISQDDVDELMEDVITQILQQETEQLEYSRHEVYYESEQTSFSAGGVIETSHGETLSFNIDLSLSREFIVENNINATIGEAVILQDPLVINFDGASAELTNSKFNFDLDVDGKMDSISAVGHNSGFLAIDLNDDKVINDGSELFGPRTGSGFQELSVYDSDHNNWIDENDPVYDKLLVWSKEPGGSDDLVSIRQKKIGAIYLGHVDTKFELNNDKNKTQGQLSSSGVYLDEEDGSAGIIQQVDLTL